MGRMPVQSSRLSLVLQSAEGATDTAQVGGRLHMKKPKKSESVFQIYCQPDESEEQAIARTMISPVLQSAATINEYANSPVELDLQAMIACLEMQASQVKNGMCVP